jgi:hypothetical protein
MRSGWGQVHRYPGPGPGEGARRHGGADSVTSFTHGGIGKPDDGESRETIRDVDLDGDRATLDAVQGGGRYRSEHAITPTDQPRAWGPKPFATAGLESERRPRETPLAT